MNGTDHAFEMTCIDQNIWNQWNQGWPWWIRTHEKNFFSKYLQNEVHGENKCDIVGRQSDGGEDYDQGDEPGLRDTSGTDAGESRCQAVGKIGRGERIALLLLLFAIAIKLCIISYLGRVWTGLALFKIIMWNYKNFGWSSLAPPPPQKKKREKR